MMSRCNTRPIVECTRTDYLHGPHKAQARESQPRLCRRLGHECAHGIMGQQEAVEFLEYAAGLLTARRALLCLARFTEPY